MPFTLAHPAAVLLLRNRFAGQLPFTALVIGSLTPDVAYFLPFRLPTPASHSLPGIVLFGLPVGLGLYIVFHNFIKMPMVSLLPMAILRRIPRNPFGGVSLHSVALIGICVSLIVGELTHIVWDSFTHASGFAVDHVPMLRSEIAVAGIAVPTYKILQHGSTLLGTSAIAIVLFRWYQATKQSENVSQVNVGRTFRAVVVSLLAAIPLLVGAFAGLSELQTPWDIDEARLFLWNSIIAGGQAFAGCLVIYCAAWHFAYRR